MEWNKIKVLIGTVDYTGWLADKEQTATLPDGPEIGRASFTLLDDGTMPAINDWSAITLKGGGTAATVNLWAGYITRQQSEPFSETAGVKRFLTLDCQSAAIKLLTSAPVTRVYGGGDLDTITTDRTIVANLIQTYAPSLYNINKIGTANQTQIEYIGFRNESLRSALNKVAERTGRTFGVDTVPEFWYGDPNIDFETVSYKLVDLEGTWSGGLLPMVAKPVYDRDATELRNSVRVLGGATLSTVQEETFAGNDALTIFQVDYYPSVVISVTMGGVAQTVGIMFVDDPADFDCLVEYDRRQFHFDTAPPTGKDVVIQYRYSTQVDVTVTDAASIASVGTIWAPVLEDSSISSAAQGSALGSAYLASTQATTRATLSTRHGGTVGTALPWEAGRYVFANVEAFGWDEEEVQIRGVTMRARPMPGGDGTCIIIWDLDVGSGPASAGRVYGRQWNNTEVQAKQVAPDRSEAQAAANDVGVTDHGALTGLADDDHTQYLLATGARTGASSQAQTFTNGIIGPTWKPGSDGATALKVQNAAGTADIVTVDTSNKRLSLPFGSVYAGATPMLNFDAAKSNIWLGNAGVSTASGSNNTGFGEAALGGITSGSNNFGAGYAALYNVGAGNNNFALGLLAMANAVNVSSSVAIGNYAGRFAAGDNGIYIGYMAGKDETGPRKLFIDSLGRTDEATARISSLVYGEIDATVASQLLRANGVFQSLMTDSAANAATTQVKVSHNTSGTAAAGFGSRVLWELESSTTADQTAAAIDGWWIDATHATRTGAISLYGSYTGTLYEAVRAGAVSGAAALGFYGVTAIARPTTSHGAASYTANSGTAVNDASTFDGYTIKQIVKALRDIGILT